MAEGDLKRYSGPFERGLALADRLRPLSLGVVRGECRGPSLPLSDTCNLPLAEGLLAPLDRGSPREGDRECWRSTGESDRMWARERARLVLRRAVRPEGEEDGIEGP